MSNQFVERNGALFKVLASDGGGAWLISHDSPAAPFFVVDIAAYQRSLPPPTQDAQLSAAAQQRLEIIQPLLDAGDTAVMDKQYRLQVSRDIAERHSTTPRTVLKLYYRYLATGQLLSPKARAPSVNPDFDWAIKTFYFSAKKLSLRGAFEMMLLQRFTDFEGKLALTRPTFGSFRAYFYSRCYHKSPRKVIARDGLTHYQRNCQPAFGSASEWRTSPGSFQMDATEADIYLRSPDGEPFRPYIYLAVDSATQLIAGVWAGESCDELAVMRCLENACRDKAEWCGQHGAPIAPEQWPSHGLPYEVITDKGREFCSGRMQELCRRYGVELITQAPFRPDRKGLVEQAFHLLQERYKSLLRGKGVIEPDAQERWAIDYRAQATLTSEERRRCLPMLSSLFVPMDYTYMLYDQFFRAIVSTYSTRTVIDEIQRTNTLFRGSAFSGYSTQPATGSILGVPGVGKTSSIRRSLSMLPQVVEHEKYQGAPFFCKQILYLIVERPQRLLRQDLRTKHRGGNRQSHRQQLHQAAHLASFGGGQRHRHPGEDTVSHPSYWPDSH